MKTFRETKEQGFSIVELIIVIAILSVLAGMSLSMTGILAGRRAYGCASTLEQQISRTKASVMAWSAGGATVASKDADVLLTLYRTGDGYYTDYTVRNETTTTLLSADRVAITAVYAKGKNETLSENVREVALSGDAVVALSFDKETGALLPEEDGSYLKRLQIEEGDRMAQVKLVPATGAVYVETLQGQTE